MKKGILPGLILLSGTIALSLLSRAGSDDPGSSTLDTIRMEDLRSIVYFLAADEMQGRDTNTLTNRIAANYLAHRFELMGLKPVGDEGTYFQHFALVQAQLGEGNHLEVPTLEKAGSRTGRLLEDFYPSPLSASAKALGPVVFVGFGITAAEHGYDDYQGLDVRGKIVAMMVHEPGAEDPESPFDGLVSSEYSHEYHKILNAQQHGAAGVLLFDSQAGRHFSRLGRSLWPEPPGKSPYHLKVWSDRIQIPALYVSKEWAELLFRHSPLSVASLREEIERDLKPRSTPLPGIEVSLETDLTRTEVSVSNVLGLLPGSDPQLRDEYVVVSAHFDHVGVRDGEIYNGADDDASGTAGMLEIAEAFSLNPQRPRRSILFAGWNAEEQGLLGSRFFVEHPPWPLERCAALFQMDMIGRNQEVPDPDSPRFRGMEQQTAEENTASLHVLGYSRSASLKALVSRLNERIGLELRYELDNHPLNLLRRSDSWPFLVREVPALFFTTGLHPDYHTPHDRPERLNYAKMERAVRLVYLCAWSAANSEIPPRLDPVRTPASE